MRGRIPGTGAAPHFRAVNRAPGACLGKTSTLSRKSASGRREVIKGVLEYWSHVLHGRNTGVEKKTDNRQKTLIHIAEKSNDKIIRVGRALTGR